MSKPIVHIVDDEFAVRDALAALCGANRIDCRLYSSASEFLDSTARDTRGCLVVDVRMAEMSGWELLKQVQIAGYTLPVILLTGYGDSDSEAFAVQAGAYDFMAKPPAPAAFLSQVRRAFAEDETQASGDAKATIGAIPK